MQTIRAMRCLWSGRVEWGARVRSNCRECESKRVVLRLEYWIPNTLVLFWCQDRWEGFGKMCGVTHRREGRSGRKPHRSRLFLQMNPLFGDLWRIGNSISSV